MTVIDPQAPPEHEVAVNDSAGRRRTSLIVWEVCALSLSLLTAAVTARSGPFAVDVSMAAWVEHHRTDALIGVMTVVSLAGSLVAVVSVGAVAAVDAVRRHRFSPLAFIVLTTAGASQIDQAMKVLIGRDRPAPPIAVQHFNEYAFPSGHATTSAALWGAVAWVVARNASPRVHKAAAGAWTSVVLSVAASRVVLGAHWPSDVLGGILLGTGCVAGAVWISQRHLQPSGDGHHRTDGRDGS